MINVLYIEKGLGKGGSALSLKFLLDAIDRQRFRPMVLFNDSQADLKAVSWGEIEVLKMPEGSPLGVHLSKGAVLSYLAHFADFFLRVLPYAIKIVRLIRTRDIRLVHLNNDTDSHIAGIIACKVTATPFVCHLRCTRPMTKTEKMVAKLVDSFVVLSESGKDFFAAQGIALSKITVSYDPFTTELEELSGSDSPEWLRNAKGKKRIGIFSRLHAGKGHEDFLTAASYVIKRVPDVHFFLIGDESPMSPGYEQVLKDRVKDLKLRPYVTFTGWVSDVWSAIAGLDIVVDASSLPEGLRRTLVEAMVLGKPVVATDVGQTRELLEKSGGGLLISCHEPKALADKLILLLTNDEMRLEMGSKGRKYATEKFDMHEKAKEIEALYENVLSGTT